MTYLNVMVLLITALICFLTALDDRSVGFLGFCYIFLDFKVLIFYFQGFIHSEMPLFTLLQSLVLSVSHKVLK